MRKGQPVEPVDRVSRPEEVLAAQDPLLSRVIATDPSRWPTAPSEDPIWGLLRVIVAQQVSTNVACLIADRMRSRFPSLENGMRDTCPLLDDLRGFGIPTSRAKCCLEVLAHASEIIDRVGTGSSWPEVLTGFKGIGPWTIATFQIMVLREPDVFPPKDLGLQRAVETIYGGNITAEEASNRWKPFRSVACWYLWRTLGNRQLG